MLAGEVERLRFLDKRCHADIVREVAWSHEDHMRTGLGLPLAALSLSTVESTGFQMLRDPDVVEDLAASNLGSGLSRLSRELVATSSAMGLIWCEEESASTFLTGGRALMRMWLRASKMQIGLCPVVTLGYMLAAWRAGQPMTTLQSEALPDIEVRYRALFKLPHSRSDIALVRMLPAGEALDQPQVTRRRNQ